MNPANLIGQEIPGQFFVRGVEGEGGEDGGRFGVWGLGSRVWGLGSRVWGLGSGAICMLALTRS